MKRTRLLLVGLACAAAAVFAAQVRGDAAEEIGRLEEWRAEWEERFLSAQGDPPQERRGGKDRPAAFEMTVREWTVVKESVGLPRSK